MPNPEVPETGQAPGSAEPDEQTEALSSTEPSEERAATFVEAAANEPREQTEIPFAEAVGETSTVNSQVTDAITQALEAVLGTAPSVAGASLAQVIAQSTGLAMLNAVSAQQNAQIAANAAVLGVVERILAIRGPATSGAQTVSGDESHG